MAACLAFLWLPAPAFAEPFVYHSPGNDGMEGRLPENPSNPSRLRADEFYQNTSVLPPTFNPNINVLVTDSLDFNGNPRCEVRSGDEVRAIAGVNWRSPLFAEIYVNVGERWRGRGWGQAVVTCCVAALLRMQVTPLYMVAEQNRASLQVAKRVGFVDTGAREIVAQATLRDIEVTPDG